MLVAWWARLMASDEDIFKQMRDEMVAVVVAETAQLGELIGRAALDERVIQALAKVPRHEFVPAELRPYAYINSPLPIGCDKTISQPFIVALMTDLLELDPGDVVLEVGTGLGYQAAVLAELAARVYSIDIIEELSANARQRLAAQDYANVDLRVGNGYYGWAEHAPYDKIMVTTAPDLIPPPLLAQLKPRGRMAIPCGIPNAQQLILVEKSASGAISTTNILPVRFSELEEGEAPRMAG